MPAWSSITDPVAPPQDPAPADPQNPAPPQDPAPAPANPPPQPPESWIPEAFRNDAAITKFKTMDSLISGYKNLEKLVGHKTTALPDEHSSDEVWRDLWSKTGCPDSPDGYKVERTKDIPEELLNSDGLKAMAKVAYDHGVSAKAFQAIVSEYDSQILSAMQSRQAEAEQAEKDALASLRVTFGRDLQRSLERAESALKVLDPEGKFGIDTSRLAGNEPVIRLLSAVGQRVLGDSLPQGTDSSTLSGIDAQIAAVQASPAFSDALHANHAQVMAQYRMLMQTKVRMQNQTHSL